MDLTWNVDNDLHFSGHFPIILACNVPVPTSAANISSPAQKIWNYKRADWALFRENVNFNVDLSDVPDIDKVISDFNKKILYAANIAIPEKKLPVNRLPVPWWDDEVKTVIAERRKCLRALRRNPTGANRIAFMRARAVARKMLKTKKRKSWSDFVSSIDHSMSSGEVFHKMGKLRSKYSPRNISAIQDRNNPSLLLYDSLSIANTLGAQFASVSSDANYSADFLSFKAASESSPIDFDYSKTDEFNCPFSYQEMMNSLLSCGSKAAGPDGISFVMLKQLPSGVLENLLRVYNFIWTSGKFPSLWSVATIIPLLKPGKDRHIPVSYRPISLLNCSSKVLEKMINKRLFWFLENKGCLNKFQSGGRYKRSTIDNLVVLEHEVTQGLKNKEFTIASFLDVQKAYDMTWRYKILKKLHTLGISGYLLRYLSKFLYNRRIRVKCNGILSDTFLLENGIIQGSSLSPLLFIVFMDDLLEITQLPMRSLLFIDDLLVVARSKSLDTLVHRFQTTLDRLLLWSKRNGLVFSSDPSKSMCINFSRSRNPPTPVLLYDGRPLKFVDKTKFLGVVWDSKLSWLPHVNYVKQRSLSALNVLKMVSNKQYGVRRSTLLRLYKAYVLPIFDYGCIVYNSARDTSLKKLDPVHNLGIRIATGALRSSPVHSLYVESGVSPLPLRREKLTMNYVSKIASCPLNPVHTLLITPNFDVNLFPPNKPPPLCVRFRNIPTFSAVILNSIFLPYIKPLPPWSFDVPTFDNSLGSDKKDNISSVAFQQHFRDLLYSKYAHFTPCYTDGSKSVNGTSCAYSINNLIVLSTSLNQVVCVYSSELIAIHLCLEHLKFLPSSHFLIISDSKSALTALSNNTSDNPIVAKISVTWRKLKDYGKTVSFLWCPSHSGIAGNEFVDNAARNPVNPHLPLKLCSPLDLKPFAAKLTKTKWQALWDTLPIPNKLKRVKPVIEDWGSSNRDNRYEEVVICRMRIGHTRTTHSFLFKRTPPPSCRCGDPLTVLHILSCHLHANIRASLPTPPALTDSPEGVDSLINYLKAIKLYNMI
ncbi:hypothetical protein M8J77_011653 [Diaphorina citri]|nr:hypothetical protein M8J77_011653 [Diaphorina citri]